MALKLPRLPRAQPIVEGTTPTVAFSTWWDSVARTLEDAVNTITQILIDLGLVRETADGALELASSAINEDGTIKDSKVLTESIITDGVTERYFTQLLAPVSLPDGVETDVMTLSVTKVEADSDIDLDIALRLASNDDIRGTMRLYRDATEIDSFDPFMNGSGGTFRTVLTLPFTDSGIAAADYEYKVTFERSGGASSVEARSGSSTRAKEIKR